MRPSLADPVGYAQANVTGTAAVLEAARRAGVSRIVFGSSSSVYGDSTPAPFREDAVAVEPGLPVRGHQAGRRAPRPRRSRRSTDSAAPRCRFFTVYGPRQRPDLAIHAFARRMIEGEAITLFGDGTQARDYTYCDDIVAGVIAAIDWTATAPIGVELFNLGGNRSVPTGAMVAELARALGIEPTAPVGADAAGRRPADRRRPDSSPAPCWATRPLTPFPEGIRRFVAWFREAYGRSD